MRASPDRPVSETPPRVGDVASEYAPPAPPPDMVVEAFLADDPASVVFPQPRYPDPPSSTGTAAMAGIVGSALGL